MFWFVISYDQDFCFYSEYVRYTKQDLNLDQLWKVKIFRCCGYLVILKRCSCLHFPPFQLVQAMQRGQCRALWLVLIGWVSFLKCETTLIDFKKKLTFPWMMIWTSYSVSYWRMRIFSPARGVSCPVFKPLFRSSFGLIMCIKQLRCWSMVHITNRKVHI